MTTGMIPTFCSQSIKGKGQILINLTFFFGGRIIDTLLQPQQAPEIQQNTGIRLVCRKECRTIENEQCSHARKAHLLCLWRRNSTPRYELGGRAKRIPPPCLRGPGLGRGAALEGTLDAIVFSLLSWLAESTSHHVLRCAHSHTDVVRARFGGPGEKRSH